MKASVGETGRLRRGAWMFAKAAGLLLCAAAGALGVLSRHSWWPKPSPDFKLALDTDQSSPGYLSGFVRNTGRLDGLMAWLTLQVRTAEGVTELRYVPVTGQALRVAPQQTRPILLRQAPIPSGEGPNDLDQVQRAQLLLRLESAQSNCTTKVRLNWAGYVGADWDMGWIPCEVLRRSLREDSSK